MVHAARVFLREIYTMLKAAAAEGGELIRNVLKCESNARHLFGERFWATPSTKQKECADEMRILRPSALRRRVWCRLQQQGGSKPSLGAIDIVDGIFSAGAAQYGQAPLDASLRVK